MSHMKLPDGRVVSMDSPEYWDYVHAFTATAPPFTAEQKAKLYPLLAPMRAAMRRAAEERLERDAAAATGLSTVDDRGNRAA